MQAKINERITIKWSIYGKLIPKLNVTNVYLIYLNVKTFTCNKTCKLPNDACIGLSCSTTLIVVELDSISIIMKHR